MTHEEFSLAAEPNSYDLIPYKSYPIRMTHLDFLATVGIVFGIEPPVIDQCRVLELGCASGGNLLPMADGFPNSRFLGIDASSQQIADGQSVLSQSGLRNIELRCEDILKFESNEPFDYIICHGVFSWVPESVKNKILDICQRHLSPRGIAYISYNTYPGWHLRGLVRDILQYRGAEFTDPKEKVAQSKELLQFVCDNVTEENEHYRHLLMHELDIISGAEEYYLLHEHFEDSNTPLYFHQFMSAATKHGLQYLSESNVGMLSFERFPTNVQTKLRQYSHDLIDAEQYMDYLRNRSFRQTLLCHQNLTIHRPANEMQLTRLHVSSDAIPDRLPVNIESTEAVTYQRGKPKLVSAHPLVKRAMSLLKDAWPASIPFSELAKKSGCNSSDPTNSDFQRLADLFLRSFATSVIDLRATPSQFAISASEFPCASTYTRVQSKKSPHVANHCHEIITLDDFQRHVISFCDGTRNRAGIVQALCQSAATGKLVVQRDGQRLTDPKSLAECTAAVLPDLLNLFAKKALFVR